MTVRFPTQDNGSITQSVHQHSNRVSPYVQLTLTYGCLCEALDLNPLTWPLKQNQTEAIVGFKEMCLSMITQFEKHLAFFTLAETNLK